MNFDSYIPYHHSPDDTTKTQKVVATGSDNVAEETKTDTSAAKPKKTKQRQVGKKADTVSLKSVRQQSVEVVQQPESPQEIQYPLHPPYQVLDTETVVNADSSVVFYADTVFAKYDTVVYRESILAGHRFQTDKTVAHSRCRNSQPDWIFIVLLVITFCLVKLLRGFYGSAQETLVAAVSKIRLGLQLRQNNFTKPNVETLTGLIYSSVLSLVVFLVMGEYGVSVVSIGILDYLIVCMAIFLFVVLKMGLMRLLGNVFECNMCTAAYVANVNIYNVLTSIMLMPLLLAACYSQLPLMSMIYIMGGGVAAMFAMRLLRGTILILSESQFSKHYLLYYAIVVEIIPLLILGKTLNIL